MIALKKNRLIIMDFGKKVIDKKGIKQRKMRGRKIHLYGTKNV